MADPRTALLARELHTLHDLTVQESVVARVRRLQARDASVRQELSDNAADAGSRAAAIAQAQAALGTPRDVAAPVLGTALALLRAQTDLLRSPSGALLGDLALEDALLAHTRFVRQLAQELGDEPVVALAERLEESHTETAAWVRDRLAEVAAAEAPAVRPLPPQLLVAAAQAAAFVPLRAAGSLLRRLRPAAQEAVQAVEERVEDVTEQVRGVDGTDVVDLTVPAENELPIKEYARLSGDTIMRHVGDMDSVDELREVLAFERAHKDRTGVVAALQARLSELAVGA